MDLAEAYIAAALAKKTGSSGSNQTVGMQDKTDPTGEIFNNYQHNVASGNQSHAEGSDTTASGRRSHAEGYDTIASGPNAHSEGASTTASGISSHAEGTGTTASGSQSHAEGGGTMALKGCSHAEGIHTIAASSCQHVQGRYNIEDSEGKFAYIIGNGTSDTERSNAFAIDWEGKIYINNSSVGIDLNSLLARLEALENK